MTFESAPLTVAVPNLDGFEPQGGIGRVLSSLQNEWGERVRLVSGTFDASRLPVLRNTPSGIRVPTESDIILLPQLTGAQALRDTLAPPSLVIVHDVGIVDCPHDRGAIDWYTRRSIMRSFYGLRYATRSVAISRFTEHRLLQHLPDVAGRVLTIPHGTSEIFRSYCGSQSDARQRLIGILGRSLGTPLLVYVGSELPRKNMTLLLEGLSQLRLTYPNAQLLKIGRAGHPNWRAKTLATAARLGLNLGVDIHLLEDIDDQMLACAYRAADVYVSSSVYEGFGLPALEAMAVGTPVVVTRRGAHPEVVEDIGWLAEPESSAFAETIRFALEDIDRDQRVERGRVRAACYTWSDAADAYLELMRRLVREART